MNRTVRPYSDGYFLVDAEIISHDRENAIVPHDYFQELSRYVFYPMLKIGNDHYWTHPERRVPGRTVVLPSEVGDIERNDPVLLAKDETAKRLVDAGIKESPDIS